MSDLEQIAAIKSNTLSQIAEVAGERKPSYTENGQSFSWTEYLEHLQRRVAWCNQMLAVEAPFEIETRGFCRMTFDPDIDDDCLLVDGQETVTLGSVTVTGAKRGPLTRSESELNRERLTSAALAWSLPAVGLGESTPQIGDTLVDSTGQGWTLVNLAFSPLTGVWRAITQQQR